MHHGSSRDMHEAEASKWCLFRINKLWVRIESVPFWPQLYKYRQVPTEVCRGSCPDLDLGALGDLQLCRLKGENCSQIDAKEQCSSYETVPIHFSPSKWGLEGVKAAHPIRWGFQAPALGDRWRGLLRFPRHWAVQSERQAAHASHNSSTLSAELPELLSAGPSVRVIATENFGNGRSQNRMGRKARQEAKQEVKRKTELEKAAALTNTVEQFLY